MLKNENSKEKIRKICAVAMLIAITVILGYISGFLRIGNITKISISFISVYIAAIFLGPVAGGFVGAVADFVSYIVNTTGAYLWQLTLFEFIYGCMFGILFSRKKEINYSCLKLNVRILVFSSIQFVFNILFKTMVLIDAGFMPKDLLVSMSLRLPGVLVAVILNFIVINLMERAVALIGKNLKR